MVAVWWLVIGGMIGCTLGIIVMAICTYGRDQDCSECGSLWTLQNQLSNMALKCNAMEESLYQANRKLRLAGLEVQKIAFLNQKES